MPCYHPLTAYRGPGRTTNGRSPITFKADEGLSGSKFKLPCGQCIGCKLERSRQWAVRLMHEAQLHEWSHFVTLTYDDQHLPHDGNLNKKHFQDFMKRLRWHYDTPIRFFHCGEYGEKFARPHYHACIYGPAFADRLQHSERNGLRLYHSPQLEQIWGHGFVSLGDVTFESAAYTARYCTKKITGLKAADHYQRVTPHGELVTVEPEYVTMSRGKGNAIARNWFDQYGGEVYPSDEVISRGHPAKPPRYYDKLFEAAHGPEFVKIKTNRNAAAAKRQTEQTPERLRVREACTRARVQLLKRTYENADT